ncbi:MAG: phage holin family protein [Clostridium sp.]|uniref:phage holin family protein n=1 Tax=Clostridium sp. TaxID=1506 RepID=UPI0029062AD4|nr:phage holin family protein [Clostridium sp.]MDU5110785.1 phage holin family protein [Clostridium sp.]
MENLLTFIPENLLILIAATYVVGVFLKKIEKIKDNYITVILMAFTIAFSMILAGRTAAAFLQGILCWGVAVGINQTGKQISRVSKEQ